MMLTNTCIVLCLYFVVEMSASKSLIADLTSAGEKLNEKNYDVWHRKVQYLLEVQDLHEPLTKQWTDSEKKEKAAVFAAFEVKDKAARITLLSCMSNNLLLRFERYRTTRELWQAVQLQYGGTSTTRLRQLTIKFDGYRKIPTQSMREHLTIMRNMIEELRQAGHTLSDEQQVQAVIRSLPRSWEHMRVNLTHNDNIRTFDDVARHVELEEDRLMTERAEKSAGEAMVAASSSRKNKKRKTSHSKAGGGAKTSGSEGYSGSHKGKNKQRTERSAKGKRNKAEIVCYRCNELGHFARECTKPKVNTFPMSDSFMFVTSCVMMAETNPVWIVDSAATDHITPDRASFVDYRRLPAGSQRIYMGNNSSVEVLGIGTCEVAFRTGHKLLLHDVLYAPDVRRSLVSVLVLLRYGLKLVFVNDVVTVYRDELCIGNGYINSGFMVLDTVTSSSSIDDSSYALSSVVNDDVQLWHARLCHIGQERMNRLARDGLLGQLTKFVLPQCEGCLAGKSTRKPFGKAVRATFPLELIHSDICGPMNVRARHGAYYFITFIDDYTRYGQVYLIAHKSDALDCFKRFVTLVENQLDKKVKTLRTDRGREYLSDQFKGFCEWKGIARQLTTPYTPQQNGVAERRNRTLLEMVRSMMSQANLPISFWGDALLTATYVLNRVPSKSVTATPYELWTGRKPNLEYLHPWGCMAFIHDPSHKHGKLGPRGRKCIFIRYCEFSKGHVFIGEDLTGTVTEIESRDSTFLENEFPSKREVSSDLTLYETVSLPENVLGDDIADEGGEDLVPPQQPPPSDIVEETVQQAAEPRRSVRDRIPRRRFEIEGGEIFLAAQEGMVEPRNVREALAGPNARDWIRAMEEEMDSMKKNHVWDLVDLPAGRKAVGNKWILKIKRKADGSIERYKARLVAKGFTQVEGVDYDETFSPVVRFASVRLILAIVASMDLELFQMDVKTAFLNGELEEEIYMAQPSEFVVEGEEHKVCKLRRSIYGLKQASRQWNLKFHQAVLSDGFEVMEEDHCVYVKRSKNSFLIMTLYVDDILLAGNNKLLIESTKAWLSSTFDMKDMGEASYVLGVKITRDRAKRFLSLSQENYVQKILERFGMSTCKPIDTPVERNTSLSKSMVPKNDEERGRMARVPYSSAVGSLMYAMLCTRPDICYAVGLVSRFQSNPGVAHWQAVKRILRYLKGTSDYVLCYQGKDLQLIGYSDADWGGDPDERKSTSGYAFLLGGGAISWCSKKQSCIALSTMEAEYIACSAAVQEGVWLKRFIERLGVFAVPKGPATIYSDSTAAIAYSKDPKYHSKAKHIEMRYHYVRDMVAQKEVILVHVSTSKMLADPLTKPIARDQFSAHVKMLGLRRV